MIIVDSSGWIEYFVDGPLADYYGKYIKSSTDIITPSIVLYEVYKKILRDADESSAVEAAAHLKKTRIMPLTADLATSAAELGVAHKLPMADAIIYATAISTGATVVTSDEHFQGLPGVDYVPK